MGDILDLSVAGRSVSKCYGCNNFVTDTIHICSIEMKKDADLQQQKIMQTCQQLF